ncbi:calcium/sodium antiporter [Virgibacillus xinjiangensis]|uniref:Calcium/sodium antiporter n=1 Tax=Virgibacillus xinjiangensis TaxID=393090 RepID=A0ABV7CW46_9BACI
MAFILLIVGLALLIKGADYFVKGASSIASNLNVSPLLIGLTIVAFGTSAPEATVSLVAALEDSAGMAIGNVVGSNIFNITFVAGLTALIYPLKVESETIRKEIPFTLLASVALLVLVSDVFLQEWSANFISRSDGFILLLFFAIFLYYLFEVARRSRERGRSSSHHVAKEAWVKNIILTLGGLAAIVFGGDLVVNGATEIALSCGMSDTLVGLTIVAVGTSLPELVTSIMAAIKREGDIALGNIVGSCIFNILFVLGTSSAISPLAVDHRIFTDVLLMILLTVILLVFSRSNYKIGKMEGIILAAAYVLYMVYVILRN